MAIRIDASGDVLRRTTGLPSDTLFTIAGWARLVSDKTGYYRYFAGIEDAVSSSGYFKIIGWTALDSFEIAANGASASFSTSPSNGQWFYFAISCNGTGTGNFKGYWITADGATVYTASSTPAAFTEAVLEIGNDSWDEWNNMRFAAIKVWDAALTQDEIRQEQFTILPKRTADLHAWWPMFPGSGERARDYSGNGKDLTEVGTLSDEDPPPVTWGAPIDTIAVFTVSFQYLRPVADTSLGGWTDQSGGTTDIYATIDETTASDSDYVQTPNNPSTNIYKLKLTSGSDPGVDTGHVISYRYRKPEAAGTVNLKVRLVEGTTTRKEWTHSNIGTSWTTQVQTLSEAEASAITDYTNLYLELEA